LNPKDEKLNNTGNTSLLTNMSNENDFPKGDDSMMDDVTLWSSQGQRQRSKPSEDTTILKERITWYLVFMTFSIVIVGFIYGYNLSNINIPEEKIRGDLPPNQPPSHFPLSIPMSNAVWGVAVSMLALGGLVGSLSGPKLSELIGRKWLLAIVDIFFLAAGLLMSLSLNTAMFIVGRFLVGIPSGMSTAIVPAYLSEISPNSVRGIVTSTFQTAICVGTLIAIIISMPLDTFKGWRWLLGITCFPSVLQLILLFFIVESPSWLIMKGNIDKAKRCIRRLKGIEAEILNPDTETKMVANQRTSIVTAQLPSKTHNEMFPRSSLDDPEGTKYVSTISPKLEESTSPMTIMEFFKTRSVVRALWVGVLIHAAQQFSGANAIFYYSTKTFEVVYGDNSKYITLGVGIVNLISVLLSTLVIDRWGLSRLGSFLKLMFLLSYSCWFIFLDLQLRQLQLLG
jgi:SP family facilitated glucose transporter-like MFS transporter 1